VAVDGLDLEVRSGECFGLLGPNGAGKTTTIEICEGLQEPDAGDVIILGQRWASDERALRERLGVQLQETQFSEKITVEETVSLFRSFFRRGPGVEEIIDLVQLAEKRGARVGTLSGGQKQRLSVACALAGDPELLFLDEPTTGLDPQSRRQLWDLVERLRASGRTIVLTTHYMEEAERLCDRIAIIDEGRVQAEGTRDQLVRLTGGVDRINLRGSGNTSAAAAALKSVPGVQHVDGGGGAGLILTVRDGPSVLPAIVTGAGNAGMAVTSVEIARPDLESVFLHLTGKALRD
jgi:ABC-2 type transport system ATP-binding protein